MGLRISVGCVLVCDVFGKLLVSRGFHSEGTSAATEARQRLPEAEHLGERNLADQLAERARSRHIADDCAARL